MAFELTKDQMFKKALVYGIPDLLVHSLLKHICQGQKVGGFLTAVLVNDFMEAVSRADPENIKILRSYQRFLHNATPADCYGSPAKVKAWRESGGLSGQYVTENSHRFEGAANDQD